jgi:SAM-dependent methyltransferase
MDHAAIFDRIYRENLWGEGSGTGSSADVTRAYREFLHNFLRSNGVRSVVDLGCGDWRFSQLIDWSGIDYLGLDVSKVVLETARRYERPGVRFRALDAVAEPLPPADLLIAKDVLQHWSNADILALLRKLPGFGYALITNGFLPQDAARTNADMPAGMDYRPVDLRRPPFGLPGAYVAWFLMDEPKYCFLWTRPG